MIFFDKCHNTGWDDSTDIDFTSVNSVLNELYKERCFRKNVQAYSALASAISHELEEDGIPAAFQVGFRQEMWSEAEEREGNLTSTKPWRSEQLHSRRRRSAWAPISDECLHMMNEDEISVSHPP